MLVPRSFAWCHEIAKRTAKNFYLTFLVLPRPQRRAMDALYAFMRVTDDIADGPEDVEQKRIALKQWRVDLDGCLAGEFNHPLHPALHVTVRDYGVNPQHFHEVIDGVEMDLETVRFATFAELDAYCYRVASAVGLCCIAIWGCRDPRAFESARAAGIALQLTNILRDLKEDLSHGRVYLPQEDLDRFRCPPSEWGVANPNFQRLMRFQVERARGFYRQAEALDRYLPPSGRAILRAMVKTYRGLLDEIERRGYDVFGERVRLPGWRKLLNLALAFPVRWGWG